MNALYVYAIVPSAAGDYGPGIDAHPVRGVAGDGVVALVHDMDRASPYAGQDADVRRWALEHAAVVERAWEVHRAALPMSFDVIVRGDDGIAAETRLRAWLRDNAADLRARLDALAGTCELKVEVSIDPGSVRPSALAELDARIEAASPGMRVLLEKKRVVLLRSAASERADELHAALRAELCGLARDVRDGRPSRTEGKAIHVLTLALLVEQGAVDDVGAALGRWQDREPGLEIRFFGPWPPYSFAETTALAAQTAPTPAAPRGHDFSEA